MRGVRVLVILLGGLNFGFQSHLGCSGENTIMCSPSVAVKVSIRVSRKEI